MRASVIRLPDLDDPVTVLPGVTPTHHRRLAHLGLHTIRDLLLHVPRRYDDLSRQSQVAQLTVGEMHTVRVELRSIAAKTSRHRKVPIVEAWLRDATGLVRAVWFNQPFMAGSITPGEKLVLAGRVELSREGYLTFTNPAWERDRNNPGAQIHTGRLVPVYAETEGLTSRWLRLKLKPLLPLAVRMPDPLPAEIRDRQGLLPIDQALRQAHFPDSEASAAAARRRLVFDQAFQLQVVALLERGRNRAEPGTRIPFDEAAARRFVAGLPFQLTRAQRRSAWEILRDMDSTRPMNRMLEGDVGSGKTVVAAFCCFMAAEAGFQSVLMAPTEILARQHHRTISALLEPHGLQVELAVGGARAADRRRLRESMGGGLSHIAVGTHALLSEGVEFAKLGLAIVDEQHRFGVEQRSLLRSKGAYPDFLTMTATPIPRTMALVLYGDLDISILDELPPGRRPVTTRVVKHEDRESAFALVRDQLDAGRQAFVICPLVELSDRTEARAATREFEALAEGELAGYRLGLLHGRLKPAEKESVMRAFVAGEIQALISTTVVEVGVDVPNATVMAVLNAERFGLAQLHQLRGRVGRGAADSHCLLLTDAEEGARRLQLLASTHDGFRLAEMDLQLRGPGEIYGARQHGQSDVDQAVLLDADLIMRARQEVELLLESDPHLARHSELALAVERRLLRHARD